MALWQLLDFWLSKIFIRVKICEAGIHVLYSAFYSLKGRWSHAGVGLLSQITRTTGNSLKSRQERFRLGIGENSLTKRIVQPCQDSGGVTVLGGFLKPCPCRDMGTWDMGGWWPRQCWGTLGLGAPGGFSQHKPSAAPCDPCPRLQRAPAPQRSLSPPAGR